MARRRKLRAKAQVCSRCGGPLSARSTVLCDVHLDEQRASVYRHFDRKARGVTLKEERDQQSRED